MRNGVDDLWKAPGQVVVPEESRYDISVHGFWKRGNTNMFNIIITNLDPGS